ncbi:MAG: hypothetical protein MUE81_04650, partial [Thermoflexibacter sp.]|nr:hypothetical protein [Thermoflexibacter sp.]
MKIIIITPWHSEVMGYSDNFLPKALAKLGHEVHLISSNAQVYYNLSFYKQVYEPFLGPPILECGTKQVEGYLLHRLPVMSNALGIYMKSLLPLVKEINPDIVQTYELDKNYTYELAVNRKKIGYRLFTANHLHASVFPNYDKRYSLIEYKAWIKHYRENLSYFYKINDNTSLCYPISTDCADIAIKYFKVPKKKIRIDPLGTDIEMFCPIESANIYAEALRKKLGFDSKDIISIYTGRFTEG